jgi:hypothetical protein
MAKENEKLRAKNRVTPRKSPIFTATSPRDGKTMKICAGNRSEGALRPKTSDFLADFMIFKPYGLQNRGKTKNLNKGLHRTAHKLPKLHGLATITPVAASNYCACALSGEP